MQETIHDASPLNPPAYIDKGRAGVWHPSQLSDPVPEYLETSLWDRAEKPEGWEVTHLLGAAYLYRERASGWPIVAKFYSAKMGDRAQEYADQEFARARHAQSFGLERGACRAVRVWPAWRGVLFLEYLPGLTLDNIIAIRHSRLGEPLSSAERSARLLATLHKHSIQHGAQADFAPAISHARGLVGELVESGVLRHNPIQERALLRLFDRAAASRMMADFVPVYVHGDATTANFTILDSGEIVATDWERLRIADPAEDLGRLMAEVSHSIAQYGGDIEEAEPIVDSLTKAYLQAVPAEWDGDALLARANFYRGTSTLRIARNAWVREQDRIGLVAQALALLA